jgi:hypothetical protein
MNGKLGKLATVGGVLGTLYTVPVTAEYATLNINIVNTNVGNAKVRVGVSVLSTPNVDDYIECDVILGPSEVLERTGFICTTGEKITLLSDVSGVVGRVHGFEEVLTGVAGPTSIPVDGTGATGLWNISISGSAASLANNLPVNKLNSGVNASATTFWRGDGTWATIPTGGGGGSVNTVTGTFPVESTGGTTPVISMSAATSSYGGYMSAADKAKLDGLSSYGGSGVSGVGATFPISSSGGSIPTISISAATSSYGGYMSAADKAKLDGLSSYGGITGVAGNFPLSSSGGTSPTLSISAATSSYGGYMSAADKAKLDGLSSYGGITSVSGTFPISSSGGTAPTISISAATSSYGGYMTPADKSKLDAITGTNTGDETGASIKTKLGIASISGVNTGDQTTITGNAGSASNINVTTDNATAATCYVNFVTSNGVLPVHASNNLTFVPSTGSLTAAGDMTAFSDERLKNDWKDLSDDFIEKLSQVKYGTFYRTDINKRQVGVSAQSLQAILPEAVLEGEYLSVAYGNAALAATVELAKANVKLLSIIEKLESRISELENKE